MIVGTEIGPGLVSAFQEPWDSAGCGPTLWTTAWRTGGRTDAPAAGWVAGAGCLWSSEMPWVPAGWGNNTRRSRFWESREQSQTTRGRYKSERLRYSQKSTFIWSLTNKQLNVVRHDTPVRTSGCPGLVFPQSARDPVHSEVLLLHHYQKQPCPDRRHRTTAG